MDALRGGRAEQAAGRSPAVWRDHDRPEAADTAGVLRALSGIVDHLLDDDDLPRTAVAIERFVTYAMPDVASTMVVPAPATLPASAWTLPLTDRDGVTVGYLIAQPAAARAPTDAERALLDLVAQLALVRLERGRGEHGVHGHAGRDRLTDLPNRAMLLEQATGLRRTGAPSTVLLGDIDRFRMINASLGHDVGDEVLRAVAGRLRTVVSTHDVLARSGGDEFAVLLADATAGDATALAGDLVHAVSAPLAVDGLRLHVTMSVGVASSTTADPEDLLRLGDMAMHEAKRLGQGQIVVRESQPDAPDPLQQVGLEQEIRDAIRSGQLRAHYQPIIRCSDQRVVGYESLVRWQHPTRGLLAPHAFLGVARDTGLVDEIDCWVLAEATAAVASWPVADDLAPSVTVNLDAMVSVSGHTIGRLLDVVATSGLPPHRLVIELTEQVFSADQAEVVRALADLRTHGVRIAIDDFGTGWSSLHRLGSVPLDMLKVDRSFIADLGGRPEAAALLDAIVTMGHALGLEIIAEGVETAEQLHEVRRLGCDMAQGYLLGRPAPAADVCAAHLMQPLPEG